MAAVQKNGWALELVKVQTVKICMDAVQQNGLALKFVKEQTDKICMDAVQQNGLALQFVKEQTDKICIDAVQQNGLALQFVKEQTDEIFMAAVQQNPEAEKYFKLPYYTNTTPIEDDVCPICQDAESDDTNWCKLNKCPHKYHSTCIDSWISKQTVKTEKTCPTCRQYIY